MSNTKSDSNRKNEGMTKDSPAKNAIKKRPTPNDPNQTKRQRIGDGGEKSRKDQVLAKLNDNPDNEGNDKENGNSHITNRDSKITNASQSKSTKRDFDE